MITAKKKAIIMGYDGARADALYNLVCKNRTSEPTCAESLYSGFNKMLHMGGDIVLALAGGENGNIQESSTAPGWATVLTGKWADENGVRYNDNILNESTPTILREFSEKGKKTCFNYIWDVHYDNTYSKEAASANENYKFIKNHGDEELHQNMLKAIADDTDIIFGIYEAPDCMGHGIGFGNDYYQYIKAVSDNDRFIYDLITTIEKRETYKDEDWLMLTVSDHGGTGCGHGGQTDYEKFVFIGSNKQIL